MMLMVGLGGNPPVEVLKDVAFALRCRSTPTMRWR